MRDRRGRDYSTASTGCRWLPERRRIIPSWHPSRRDGCRSLRIEDGGVNFQRPSASYEADLAAPFLVPKP